jgi:hypothetical protein
MVAFHAFATELKQEETSGWAEVDDLLRPQIERSGDHVPRSALVQTL